MRDTLCSDDLVPMSELGNVARRITFSTITKPSAPKSRAAAASARPEPLQEVSANLASVSPAAAGPTEKRNGARRKPAKRERAGQTRTAHEHAQRTGAMKLRQSLPHDRTAEQRGSGPEPISVVLRIRPLSASETAEGPPAVTVDPERSGVVEIVPRNPSLHNAAIRANSKAAYSFARVYEESASQECVFTETALPLIQALFDGVNGLIFAYGTSNAGKTYTIQGTPNEPGLLPRATDVIFNSIAAASTSRADTAGLPEDSTFVSDRVARIVGKRFLPGGSGERSSRESSDVPSVREQATVVAKENAEYEVSVSYLEIYNEQCFDLLCAPPQSRRPTQRAGAHAQENPTAQVVDLDAAEECEENDNEEDVVAVPSFPACRTRSQEVPPPRRKVLKLKEDRSAGEVYVDGLTEVVVESLADVHQLMMFGQSNRSVAATGVNERSSRSHTIFGIKLVQTTREARSDRRGRALVKTVRSRLSVVDLAGSERASRTRNNAERLREASLINKSLMNLGHCLEALRKNQMIAARAKAESRGAAAKGPNRVAGDGGAPARKTVSVPFRQSRLTRLFQQNLQSGTAVMIANVSPAIRDADETIHALRRAAVARQVTITTDRSRSEVVAPDVSRLVSPSRLLDVQKKFESKAEHDAQVISQLKADVAILRSTLDEANVEFASERQELEREQDELWRENETLRERLAHAESRFAVREKELREEIMAATEDILAQKEERFRLELERMWTENEQISRAKTDIVTNTARKQLQNMERRHRREIGDNIARRVSMAVLPQPLEDEDVYSDEVEYVPGSDAQSHVYDGHAEDRPDSLDGPPLTMDDLEFDDEEYDDEGDDGEGYDDEEYDDDTDSLCNEEEADLAEDEHGSLSEAGDPNSAALLSRQCNHWISVDENETIGSGKGAVTSVKEEQLLDVIDQIDERTETLKIDFYGAPLAASVRTFVDPEDSSFLYGCPVGALIASVNPKVSQTVFRAIGCDILSTVVVSDRANPTEVTEILSAKEFSSRSVIALDVVNCAMMLGVRPESEPIFDVNGCRPLIDMIDSPFDSVFDWLSAQPRIATTLLVSDQGVLDQLEAMHSGTTEFTVWNIATDTSYTLCNGILRQAEQDASDCYSSWRGCDGDQFLGVLRRRVALEKIVRR